MTKSFDDLINEQNLKKTKKLDEKPKTTMNDKNKTNDSVVGNVINFVLFIVGFLILLAIIYIMTEPSQTEELLENTSRNNYTSDFLNFVTNPQNSIHSV